MYIAHVILNKLNKLSSTLMSIEGSKSPLLKILAPQVLYSNLGASGGCGFINAGDPASSLLIAPDMSSVGRGVIPVYPSYAFNYQAKNIIEAGSNIVKHSPDVIIVPFRGGIRWASQIVACYPHLQSIDWIVLPFSGEQKKYVDAKALQLATKPYNNIAVCDVSCDGGGFIRLANLLDFLSPANVSFHILRYAKKIKYEGNVWVGKSVKATTEDYKKKTSPYRCRFPNTYIYWTDYAVGEDLVAYEYHSEQAVWLDYKVFDAIRFQPNIKEV